MSNLDPREVGLPVPRFLPGELPVGRDDERIRFVSDDGVVVVDTLAGSSAKVDGTPADRDVLAPVSVFDHCSGDDGCQHLDRVWGLLALVVF